MSPFLWSWRSCFTSKDLSSFTEFITREGMPVGPNPQSVDSSDPRPVWNGAAQQEVSSGWENEPSFFSCPLITLINAWTIIALAPHPWKTAMKLVPGTEMVGITGACSPSVSPGLRQGQRELGVCTVFHCNPDRGHPGKDISPSSPEELYPYLI